MSMNVYGNYYNNYYKKNDDHADVAGARIEDEVLAPVATPVWVVVVQHREIVHYNR
jgi:hypothetical protein